MNRDSDIPEEILLRLLLEPLSVDDSQSGTCIFSPANVEPAELDGTDDLLYCPSDPSPETSTPVPAAQGDNAPAAHITSVFDSGDLSTVQPHFEALLKRRLRQEIDHHPPLFPWEKGLQHYPDMLQPMAGVSLVWLDHLKSLSLPGAMPEDVLADLLNQCQCLAQDLRQTGKRLVAAVESLFPDQPQTLEYIAGLVARPAYRSAQTATLSDIDYATASTQQQMALAMLAAQGIFEALSLLVSAAEPTQERVWLTTAGPLTVQTTYSVANSPLDSQLEVRVVLPLGGTLALISSAETLDSERSTPGELVLRLAAQPGTDHRLEVSLAGAAPLSFQITVAEV
jgi:hypothetical protein